MHVLEAAGDAGGTLNTGLTDNCWCHRCCGNHAAAAPRPTLRLRPCAGTWYVYADDACIDTGHCSYCG
jgi:hypothetical protein